MAMRPILFSTPMVRALLEGRKSQTRRLTQNKRGNPTAWLRLADAWDAGERELQLWVREAFRKSGSGIVFRADCSPVDNGNRDNGNRDAARSPARVWRPSIHLPRAASRLTLVVTTIAREHLQDISEDDVVREGAGGSGVCGYAEIWSSIHGASAWQRNPAVIVLTFEVEQRNIDHH